MNLLFCASSIFYTSGCVCSGGGSTLGRQGNEEGDLRLCPVPEPTRPSPAKPSSLLTSLPPPAALPLLSMASLPAAAASAPALAVAAVSGHGAWLGRELAQSRGLHPGGILPTCEQVEFCGLRLARLHPLPLIDTRGPWGL